MIHRIPLTGYGSPIRQLSFGASGDGHTEYLQLRPDGTWQNEAIVVRFCRASGSASIPVGSDYMVAVPEQATATPTSSEDPGTILIEGTDSQARTDTVSIAFFVAPPTPEPEAPTDSSDDLSALAAQVHRDAESAAASAADAAESAQQAVQSAAQAQEAVVQGKQDLKDAMQEIREAAEKRIQAAESTCGGYLASVGASARNASLAASAADQAASRAEQAANEILSRPQTEIDPTLTLSGAAAEAQAVGQKFGEMESAVQRLNGLTVGEKNLLRPMSTEERGISIQYNDRNAHWRITGTKVGSARIKCGFITPKVSGQHSISFVDHTGGGKCGFYICEGTTQLKYIQAVNFTNNLTFDLTEGVEYTLEAYVAPGNTMNVEISIMVCYGNVTAERFQPYSPLMIDVNRLNPWELRRSMLRSELAGKKLSILGSSLDAYAGQIPGGCIASYSDANLGNVNGIWWKQVLDETGMTLLKNNSSAGSCAATGHDDTTSGYTRCLQLDDGDSMPDMIIVGIFGICDWLHTSIGIWDHSMAGLLPGADTNPDVSETYAGAMAAIFYRIQEKYPLAKIYAMDLFGYRIGDSVLPIRMEGSNAVSVADYNRTLREIADLFGVTVISASQCGIHGWNSNDYMLEGSTLLNENGQKLIAQTVLRSLEQDF